MSRLRVSHIVLIAALGTVPPVAAIAGAQPRARFAHDMVLSPRGGATTVQLPGSRAARRLRHAERVPLGTTVDAHRSHVLVTTAQSPADAQQSIELSRGAFTVSQDLTPRPHTDIALVGDRRQVCGGASSARADLVHRNRKHARDARVFRRLAGSESGSHGRMAVDAEYARVSVRGTEFTVEDRCDGTSTSVRQGHVDVIPLDRVGRVSLGPGRSALVYCASPRPSRPTLTCTVIVRPIGGVGGNIFFPQILTTARWRHYELCLTPPGGRERCHTFAFQSAAGSPRSSRLFCVTSGKGTYRARWRRQHELLGQPLYFTLPRPTSTLPHIGGRCFERLTQPPGPSWKYGPPVLHR